MSSIPPIDPPQPSPAAIFFAGWRAAWTSVFVLVLIGTYRGGRRAGARIWLQPRLGAALDRADLGRSRAGDPALGAGRRRHAVRGRARGRSRAACGCSPWWFRCWRSSSGRIRGARDLILPAHLTAVSMWVEALRLVPALPRAQRISFCNGLGIAFMVAAHGGAADGLLSGGLAAGAAHRGPRCS